MQRYKDELKNKKRKKFLTHLGLFLVVGLSIVFGLIYLLFFGRFLDVRSIKTEAVDDLRADIVNMTDSWLDEGLWRFTRRNNILFFSGDKLASELMARFPKLESVGISKDFPHAVSIITQERKPIGIWCLGGDEQCFYFDKTGVVFSQTQPSAGFLILNVADQRARELKLGEKVVADNWLVNITIAKALLFKIEINVSKFVIPPDSFDEFYAKTAEGWKIMFSNQTDVESQIGALATFLKEKLNISQRAGLQYVDLRIQDRIYYR